MLQVHRPFGVASTAGRITPKTNIFPGGLFGFEFVGGMRDAIFKGQSLSSGGAHDDDVFEKRGPIPDLFDFGQGRFMDDDRPRPAVIDQVEIIVGKHPRVDGHCHRADFDRPEKAVREFRRVRQNEQHAVLDVDPEFF
jgi:hypothetical protein